MAEQHEKALVPQIRFTGFTDPWEQRKLGELFVIGGSGGTPSATNASYYGGDIPFLGISDIKNRDITITAKSITEKGLENSAAWIIPAGSICLAMYASVGKAGINRVSLATSQAFYNMVFEDETLRDFIYTRLEKADTDNEWNPLISTGTQANLNADKVKSFRILLPSSDERRLIAKYFADLDSLITLHQRKYDKLCVLKKSMLDKMFPKGGSLYPEIRFAGFTDPWEQRKLGDILQERNIRTSDFEGNPIFSLTIEDGVTPKTDRYERTSLITKTEDLFKIVSPNEFVTNPMNLRFGAFGYNKNSFSVCVSGYYDVFSIDNDKCSGFWSSYFKTPIALKRFDDAATGSLIEKRRVKFSTLCQLVFLMPEEMKEKKQIAAFFDRLDSLITLHQRKYDGCANPLFLERRISCRKPSHQNRCSATTTPSG